MKKFALLLMFFATAVFPAMISAQIAHDKTEIYAPGGNYLVLQVEPAYSIVFIDGQPQAVTEGIATVFLTCGKHRYKVQAPGHAISEGLVEIVTGNPVVKRVSLTPEQPNMHITTVLSGTAIYVNGEYRGVDEWHGTLAAGTYHIEGRKDGRKSFSGTVQVGPSEVLTVTIPALAPLYGTIKVDYEPAGARVTLDGVYRGTTPMEINDVVDGAHKIEISAPGYESRVYSVTMAYGQTNTLRGTLEETRRPVPAPVVIVPDTATVAPDRVSPATPAKPKDKAQAKPDDKPQARQDERPQTQTPRNPRHTATSKRRPVVPLAVNGVAFTMILVDGGSFEMGASTEQGSSPESDEEPLHNVTLSSYYICDTEVTQDLWEAVMGYNPSAFKGGNMPVEQISWNDCMEFVARINQMTGLRFRLPTEAEWEFASRGGKKSNAYRYSGGNDLNGVGWYIDNSSLKPHPVKTKAANELGIYDMSGNVGEWCSDWYGSYTQDDQTDPSGASTGTMRVIRGGNKSASARGCRVSARDYGMPSSSSYNVGLRLVMEP